MKKLRMTIEYEIPDFEFKDEKITMLEDGDKFENDEDIMMHIAEYDKECPEDRIAIFNDDSNRYKVIKVEIIK